MAKRDRRRTSVIYWTRLLPRHTVYDRFGELVGVLGTFVLVCHWSDPEVTRGRQA